MIAEIVECGVCKGSGTEPGDAFRICGHCVGSGQLTSAGHTARTALQAMDYAAREIGGNGYDIVMEARAAVAELIEASKEASGWVDQVSAAGCKALDRLDAALARVGGAA